MNRVHLDFETRSVANLPDTGVYRYAVDKTTQAVLLAYGLDNDAIKVWEPLREPVPRDLTEMLEDPMVEKWAFNAAFERLIFKFVLGIDVPIEEWRCAQVLSRYNGLPSNLEDAGRIVGLSQEDAKIHDGSRLIDLFSKVYIPERPTALFGTSPAVFKDWNTNPDDWQKFREYVTNDVRSEKGIVHILEKISPVTPREWENWWIDQRINSVGIPLDEDLIIGANKVIEVEWNRLFSDLTGITKLDNANSRNQILGWAQDNGYPFSVLGKSFVARALAGEGNLTDECRKVLELRTQLAKSSVSKFEAFEQRAVNGRLYYSFGFMGAARTGRWSGSGLQFQNLLRPTPEVEKRLEEAIALVKAADTAKIQELFKSSVFDVVASCLRPVFKAPEGENFVIADLSQIESIVVGWISNCKRIVDVYTSPAPYNDAYRDFGVDFYGKKFEDITKDERNICKPAVLGCNYRLSAGEEKTTSDGDKYLTGLRGYAANMGVTMTQEEADKAVKIFRQKFPEVKKLWYDWEAAYISAVKGVPATAGRCRFEVRDDIMFVRLPSGRDLHYFNPRIEENVKCSWQGRDYEKTRMTFRGLDEKHQWSEMEIHGGHGVENLAQSIARDILAEGLRRAVKMGFILCAHVHDEQVGITPVGSALSKSELELAMSDSIDWAPGLPIRAVGFTSPIYKKG